MQAAPGSVLDNSLSDYFIKLLMVIIMFQTLKNPNNCLILNGMLLVDTFLLLSAFLFSRILLAELDKRRGKLNVLPILLFRYIR